MMFCLLSIFVVILLGFIYWRYVWFFRNPHRNPPDEEGLLSPADGRVVYVRKVSPDKPVISIKRGVKASVGDIVREDMTGTKILIGVFMSPFDVHYNRAPLSGYITSVRHYPPKGKNRYMISMHLRFVFRHGPYYQNSVHVINNERTVTMIDGRYRGQPLSCYVVQIAGKSVRGIESYVEAGGYVERGDVFGMIRVGSQVDLVVPWGEGMEIKVAPGDRVRAGETIFVQ
jgi:phosphatidylserine decarboxylase